MQYPLPESIGPPDLLVGRKKEFDDFHKWIGRIPMRLSKSRAILARRKSGKTAFLQRIFNQLWSQNGQVIPFYINIAERKIWLPDFAILFYRTFASQYISFRERDHSPLRSLLELEQIREYGLSKNISKMADDADFLKNCREKNLSFDIMWETASNAPHRYASLFDIRFLVMIDEFQNTGEYIYMDEKHEVADKSIPGTWHDLSESKYAPMLVTGSYVGWLINIIDTYLEAGRLKRFFMNPYLPPEEGLEAVYRYAEHFHEPVTNESALQINRLCLSDPFFISCVIQSGFEGKDLTAPQGVVDTVHHEITDRLSEMSMTWGEYIELSLKRINTVHSKHLMLHLSKYPEREWTPRELKEELGLGIDEKQINILLKNMVSADLIREGNRDMHYRGLTDGTLCLILRNRFEEEIRTFQPDVKPTDLKKDFREELEKLKKEKKSLRGMVNHLSGIMAEHLLATEFRSRKRFSLSRYFANVKDDTELNVTDVKMRVKFQRPDGKFMETDVIAASECGRILMTEVKNTKDAAGLNFVQDFWEKITVYAELHPERQILPAYFSAAGFTKEAQVFCEEKGIAFASELKLF